MKLIYLSMLFLSTSIFCHSQNIDRYPNESAEVFVKRIFKVTELSHPIIETNEWNKEFKSIICFIEFDEGKLGYLLNPISERNYQKILIDTFFNEGGAFGVKIESVFFINADKDTEREIAVSTKAEAHSPRYSESNIEGTYYSTYIYDNPYLITTSKRLKNLSNLFRKFQDEFEGTVYKNGKLIKTQKAIYKNISAIKNALDLQFNNSQKSKVINPKTVIRNAKNKNIEVYKYSLENIKIDDLRNEFKKMGVIFTDATSNSGYLDGCFSIRFTQMNNSKISIEYGYECD